MVLIYPRANNNYSRSTLAMFRAISESPNKTIFGLSSVIPFIGMNLISEVLGLDLTLIPERKDDLDQVEDDSILFPSDVNREQLFHLMEPHGMMSKDDEEDSMGQQTPNIVNRGMSNYDRRGVEDDEVRYIQPRSLGILAKLHPSSNIRNEGKIEVSAVSRERRSADSDEQDSSNESPDSSDKEAESPLSSDSSSESSASDNK